VEVTTTIPVKASVGTSALKYNADKNRRVAAFLSPPYDLFFWALDRNLTSPFVVRHKSSVHPTKRIAGTLLQVNNVAVEIQQQFTAVSQAIHRSASDFLSSFLVF